MDAYDERTGRAGVFLVTGCQRSGTTLLAMALEAHPSIDMVEEDNPTCHVFGEGTLELDLAAVRRRAETGAASQGYKAPRDSHRMAHVREAIPEARVVWIEREIRQAVASMVSLRVRRRTALWATSQAPLEINKYLTSTGDPTAAAILADIRSWRRRRERAVGLGTLCWLVKRAQRVAATDVMGDRLRMVGYDDLVTDPSTALAAVLDFLELSWDPAVLDHPARIEHRPRPGRSHPSRSIDDTSRQKWEGVLSSRDLGVIERVQRSFEQDTRDSPAGYAR